MPKLIRDLPSLPGMAGLPELPELDEAEWKEPPATVDLVMEPELPGEPENVLEKNAVQGRVGTLPERIIWKWLVDQRYQFNMQQAEFGGRGQLGGTAIDFVVRGLAAVPVALRVQGGYWHGPQSDRKAQDDQAAGRLRMAGYLVVDLWEQEIYQAVRGDRLTEYVMWRII